MFTNFADRRTRSRSPDPFLLIASGIMAVWLATVAVITLM